MTLPATAPVPSSSVQPGHDAPAEAEAVTPAATLAALRRAQPCLWLRPAPPATGSLAPATVLPTAHASLRPEQVLLARARFDRYAPLLAALAPELAGSGGIIESPLLPAPALRQALGLHPDEGRLYVKADHGLAVAGSIKARGGIHEVLQYAESLATQEGLLRPGDDYRMLGGVAARACFARHRIAVGSTGNLGMSIGIIASLLGFQAEVHMSADAKAWKKARLRSHGVKVIEHAGDYEQAVAAGRAGAEADPHAYFVDDERSPALFAGYAAAALHLRDQLRADGIAVDADHPLFVYLPCGVGGAPGGIAYGLKMLFGDHVHCFFAEPVQSPCFLLGMMARCGQAPGLPALPSVYDIGLENRTEADGLAVPRASELALDAMVTRLAGIYTVSDDRLLADLARLHEHEGLRVEPSAAAGFGGPAWLCGTQAGQAYLRGQGLQGRMGKATHLAWTTGGRFVPPEEFEGFLRRGKAVLAAGAA
ncbi:D-serine ammonia-lyase [Achromobacter aloeverae]|uniref:Probable D-serine dehydratase n=1 Tax=Achromobacter aloeverae TaxID=1750518 RepID=A0A4Q1HMJ3_9BURK|nr:D-serine ammonia-lyase [Achromobacter aloeverae]RXN91618.1 D-serine ammonia-lyase [Achromobacter aloeverae]